MDDLGVYVVDDGSGELVLVRASEDEMERDFWHKRLKAAYLCLRRELPKDLVKMIVQMVERDYTLDHVWKFLQNPVCNWYDIDITKTISFAVKDVKKYEQAYHFLASTFTYYYPKRFCYQNRIPFYFEPIPGWDVR